MHRGLPEMWEAVSLESAKGPLWVRGGRRRGPWKQIDVAAKVVVGGEVVDLGRTELDRRGRLSTR